MRDAGLYQWCHTCDAERGIYRMPGDYYPLDHHPAALPGSLGLRFPMKDLAMMLRFGTARGPLRILHGKLAVARYPLCHGCGAETRFRGVLDEPVYGEPGKALAQYVCDACETVLDELRPL